MKIVIFNVGPALSAYVEMGSNKIVVDLGKGNDFSMVNDFLLPLFKKRGELKNSSNKYYLNQVFISHPHLDHISDLDDLDKHFYINLFTTPNDLSKGRESYKNINWDLVYPYGESFLPKNTMSIPNFVFSSFCSSSLLELTSRYFFNILLS